jgi:hypothetical protein
MKLSRLVVLLVGAVSSAGCFQFATTLNVQGDGSGTLNQRLLFTSAALEQFRGLAALGGGRGQNFDPISEEQARAAAATLGPGVTYVSSTPIRTAEGQGRDIVYGFSDINQLRLSDAPSALGGGRLGTQGLTNGDPLEFVFARQPSGTALLTIKVPRPSTLSRDLLGPKGRSQISPDQIEMFKQMLVGARLAIAVEPAGKIVRTNSQYVDGQRVTLIDVSLDRLLDETVRARLLEAKTEEDAKAALANVPGIKVSFDPEITIEFTPIP